MRDHHPKVYCNRLDALQESALVEVAMPFEFRSTVASPSSGPVTYEHRLREAEAAARADGWLQHPSFLR